MSTYTPFVTCQPAVDGCCFTGQEDDEFGTFVGASGIPIAAVSPGSSRGLEWDAHFSALESGSESKDSLCKSLCRSENKMKILNSFEGQKFKTNCQSSFAAELESENGILNAASDLGYSSRIIPTLHCPKLTTTPTQRSSGCVCSQRDSLMEGKGLHHSTDQLKHSQSIPEGSRNRSDDLCVTDRFSDSFISCTNDQESSPKEAGLHEVEEDFGDFSSREAPFSVSSNDDLGDFSPREAAVGVVSNNDAEDFSSNEVAVTVISNDDFADFAPKEVAASVGSNDDFGSSSSKEVSVGVSDKDDFGVFLSKDVVFSASSNYDFADFSTSEVTGAANNDDEFGDFSSKEAAVSGSSNVDFGDFSAHPKSSQWIAADHFNSAHGSSSIRAATGAYTYSDSSGLTSGVKGYGDGFGDFTAPAAGDADWADFAVTSSVSVDKDAVGDKADAKGPPLNALMSSDSQKVRQSMFAKAASRCFPGSLVPTSPLCQDAACVDESGSSQTGEPHASKAAPSTESLAPQVTAVKCDSQWSPASLPVWHTGPLVSSRQDSGARLWNHLQAQEGSPAVGFLWATSSISSHHLDTLRIDTQNMLRGHKKRAVPVYTTGLSLLEASHGGRRERRGAEGGQSASVSSSLALSARSLAHRNSGRRVQHKNL